MSEVTRDNLNEVMEFDHVIRINSDLSIQDTPVWAPDVTDNPDGDVFVSGDGWVALNGFTGQYGYHGAVMHSSEYVGGGLADYILSTPGYYAVVEVRDELGEYPDGDAIGWAIVFKELGE